MSQPLSLSVESTANVGVFVSVFIFSVSLAIFISFLSACTYLKT